MQKVIDRAYLERQLGFSLRTFGPGARTQGVLDHINKELKEIEDDPSDMEEWADLVILAFDGALRYGHDPQDLIDTIINKHIKNESRNWPDWRTADRNKAIEHIRD